MTKSSKSKKSEQLKETTGKSSKKGSAEKSMNPAMDESIHELFLDSIKDIYWAENHLVKAIPKMIKSASGKALISALTNHLAVTKTHVIRLEEVFALLNEKAKAKKCEAMEGLSKEGEGVIEDTKAGTAARDLGIIMASQKVEHYEMAAYTGLSKLAAKLGHTDIADLLNETLLEEEQADNTLAGIAENDISYPAK